MKILVTGGTGSVGQQLIPRLLKKGLEVQVLTRKIPAEPAKVHYIAGDMLDPVSMQRALDDVDKVFLLNAVAAEEETQALITIGMAKRARVKHITYLSVLAAEQFPDVPHFASKVVVEAALRDSSVNYTILRPAMYFQNDLSLKNAIVGAGVYPLPIGSKGISATDVSDIAEVAAMTLAEPGHEGQTYDIASPELMSGPENAEVWSSVLGKTVRYAGHDFDRFEEQMRSHMEAWKAYDLRAMFEGFVNRGFVAPEAEVAKLTTLLGRQPRTYKEFAVDTAKQWAPAKS